LLEESHGKVDTLGLAIGSLEISWPRCTGSVQDGIVVCLDLGDGVLRIGADMSIGNKLDAFSSEKIDSALEELLVELHVGDTVHHQTTDSVIPVIDGDGMTSLVELIGGGETGRS